MCVVVVVVVVVLCVDELLSRRERGGGRREEGYERSAVFRCAAYWRKMPLVYYCW